MKDSDFEREGKNEVCPSIASAWGPEKVSRSHHRKGWLRPNLVVSFSWEDGIVIPGRPKALEITGQVTREEWAMEYLPRVSFKYSADYSLVHACEESIQGLEKNYLKWLEEIACHYTELGTVPPPNTQCGKPHNSRCFWSSTKEVLIVGKN